MKRLVSALAAGVLAALPAVAQRDRTPPDPIVTRLKEAAQGDAIAYQRLAFLCDRIGARIAGSLPYSRAVDWAVETFKADGVAVRLEPVKTELWVRGRERLVITAPFERELPMLGLGESVGTTGVDAEVVVVHDFAELSDAVKGRIVLFDPVVPADATSGQRYGIFARFRVRGPSEAAARGAVAVLVRSVPLHSLGTPHTGTLIYDPAKPKVPAAAITAEDSQWLARLAEQKVPISAHLEMEAHSAGLQDTANVVAEIPGTEHPEEIVLVSGHLDSWDVGQGAHDDGVGVIQTIETMRLVKALGVAPKRTIRAVLFVNEEHGTDGGKAYAAAHGAERHVAALESDGGGGEPQSWGASGTPQQLAWMLDLARPTGLPVSWGGGGTDIQPLTSANGVLAIGLRPDTTLYFDVHHTRADTLDKVDPRLLQAGLADIAVLIWQLANASTSLEAQ